MRLDTPEGPLPLRPPSRRAALGTLFFAGYAAAGAGACASPVRTEPAGVEIEEVTYPAAEGYALPAYVARPSGAGPFPAVIVINEIFGIHAYIQDVCRRLAEQGYLAIAPDYFDRAGDPAVLTDIQEVFSIVNATPYDQVIEDTRATLAYLSSRPDVAADRIGVTGFCWGGRYVWMAAALFDQIKAGVAWYGRLEPSDGGGDPQTFPTGVAALIRAPVLGLYAGADRGIPLDSVERMRAGLQAADNPTGSQIVVYPGAEHGFHADYRPSYNEAAARDGWARLLAWFQENGVG
jgi:carboxymethylenebutenolidase